LAHLSQLVSLIYLNLGDTQVDNSGLKRTHIPSLRSLSLKNTNVDEGAVGQLRQLPNLENADIRGTKIDDDLVAPLFSLFVHREDVRLAREQREEDNARAAAIAHPMGVPDPEAAARALAGIQRLKGDFELDMQRRVKFIGLKGAAITDAQLALLAPFRKILTGVSLYQTNITDAGLKLLEEMPNLEYVNLQETKVGDEGISHLRKFMRLDYLDLTDTHVTNTGLQHVKGLRRLTSVHLGRTRIDDAGLATLKDLRYLKWLWLHDTQVGDEGLLALEGLEYLDTLLLNGTKVTDRGIESLTKLPSLRYLRLDGTAVTDAGLEYIKAMPMLETVTLDDTHVSLKGLAALDREVNEARARQAEAQAPTTATGGRIYATQNPLQIYHRNYVRERE
jgi:hypothetical protein